MPDPVTHYQGDAGRQYHEVKRGLPPAARPWVARLRALKFQPLVDATDTVLEYGVGAGWNLAALVAARRIGCDVAEFLRPEVEGLGVEFVTDTAGLPDRLAQVVLCHHALEHLLAPAAALAELRRLLRPGGVLMLHVPSESESRYRRFDPAEPNHHLYSWTVQTLGRLVTDCGFHVTGAGLERYGYDRFAAAWAVRLGLGERGFRLLRRALIALRPLREIRLHARRPDSG
jgi:SAM-dependent methyltransferase